MRTTVPQRILGLVLLGMFSVPAAVADDRNQPDTADVGTGTAATESDPSATTADSSDRRARLAEYLTDCDFVGRYTTAGKAEKLPKPERYTISSCKALAEDEMYELAVRIRYGNVDSEVPMKVRIVFADQTPVITLDQLWIPGMGTFDARVMIRRDRYAGTWQHDNHGGHLFGMIEQRTDDGESPAGADK